MINQIIKKLFRILVKRNPLDIFLGRLIYGNDASFSKNLEAKLLQNKKYQYKDESNIEKYGYEKLENIISPILTENLKKKFHSSISNISEIEKELRYDFTSMHNPFFFSKFSEVKDIFNSQIHECLENYYNGHFKVVNVHIYRILKNQNTNKNDTSSYGSSITWHNDGSRADNVKVFISLNVIDENSGPMEFISKEDTKKIFRNNPFIFNKINLASKIENMECKKKMTFYERDAYIINTNTCLHRAQSPNSGHRDLLVYYCQSSKKPFNYQWEIESTKNIY